MTSPNQNDAIKERSSGKNVPWALFKGEDIYWIGLAESENAAWTIALGWPDMEEIAAARAGGMFATRVNVEPKIEALNPTK